MAGYENIKNYGFDKRTAEELRVITSKGGKASGEVRRRKADFRRTLNLLLTAKIDSPEWTPLLESLGLESTLESAMLAAQVKEAISGNVKAAYFVAQYAGQNGQTEADDEEQRIRTDRARQARSQELGETDSGDESIQNFLKAVHPCQSDLDAMFADDETEVAEDAEAEENTGV